MTLRDNIGINISMWPGLCPAFVMLGGHQYLSRSGRWASSNRRATLPSNWPRLRRLVLDRDPVCTIRTHCHGALSEEVDHIGEPGDHRPHMLRGACTPCHKARTQGQAMQARGAGPLRRRPPDPHPGLTA